MAFVTLTAGSSLTPDQLEAWAAEHVPERDAIAETPLGDEVQAVLIAGEVEIHVPRSSHDDEVRAALSQYAWTWKLTS